MADDHDPASTGQVSSDAAVVYDEFFVPALFAQFPERVLEAAGLSAGDTVLDVGCGTGVLAQVAARQLAGSGAVTGVDVNPGMLDVARRGRGDVSWRLGEAEDLPFTDGSFDRVVSQFALMFFADPTRGLTEMRRVARAGGTVTLATWASVDESPGYAAMVDLVRRLLGDRPAAALASPFTLGTVTTLLDLVRPILPGAVVTRLDGVARFASLEAWLHTDIRGWTLAEMVDDAQFQELSSAARAELAEFVAGDGSVRFDAPALLVTAPVPARDDA